MNNLKYGKWEEEYKGFRIKITNSEMMGLSVVADNGKQNFGVMMADSRRYDEIMKEIKERIDKEVG